jgi:uncharacterized membrane protein
MNKERIAMKKRLITMVCIAFCMGLTACGAKQKSNENSRYLNPEVQDNQLKIAKTELSDHVKFINYDSNGTTIQLIAVIASDDTYRLSLNTCQSCNPSPRAYFNENAGKLVCQNCGNAFTADDVGVSSSGCHPMNIEYEEDENFIIVAADVLDGYQSAFAHWQGPVNSSK